MTNPRISIIIPVFNTERYLYQCLASLQAQTFSDFEIIAINDGCSDGSPALLQKFQEKDARIRVIKIANQGAGFARNIGIKEAKGEYLLFLDSDDFFAPRLLEEAYQTIMKYEADIVIFGITEYSEKTQEYVAADNIIQIEHAPYKKAFSYRDMPQYIFNAFQSWPWNKMFRRKFVEENGLEFQNLRRTNDLYFVYCALVTAQRIVVLPANLVYYRKDNATSSQASNHLAPTDFYQALTALQDFLKKKERYPEVKQSFVNMAASGCLYNLKSLKTETSFTVVYDLLKNEAFRKLDIAGQDKTYFFDPEIFAEITAIMTLSSGAYLFNRLESLQSELQKTKKILNLGKSDQPDLFSYKLGRILSFPLRKLRGGIKCIADHGWSYTLRYTFRKLKKPGNFSDKI